MLKEAIESAKFDSDSRIRNSEASVFFTGRWYLPSAVVNGASTMAVCQHVCPRLELFVHATVG
jgi:hypothetical protein